MSKSTGSFGDLVQDSSDRASTEISTGSSSLVRTKTSFSIHFTQLLLNDSRLKSPSNSSLQVQRPGWDIEVTESTEQVSLEDGVLRNSPEHMRFSAIWSHPISRLYFLMYLIWRGQENLFLLRMEILDYRNGFYKLPSQAARISSAKRIRKMFLTQGSPLFVDFPEYLSDPSVHDVLERVAYLIDTADISIFDDLAFVALLSMEHAFSGQFTPSGIETDRPFLSFKQSGFIQIMRNDLRI
jgi:hypothetical protein